MEAVRQPPKAITVASRNHQWSRPAAKAAAPQQDEPKPAPAAAPQPNLKFGGSGQGWGADLAATIEKSVEFNSTGTNFGQSRITFKTPKLIDESPPPASKPDFPSLPANRTRVQVNMPTREELRLQKLEDERKKQEKAEEIKRKKEETAAKKKLKAERQTAMKECLKKGSNNFQGPLDMAVIQTGTLELEFPEASSDRKKFLKYLAHTLVNSIISEEHDPTYPRILKMLEKHKTFEPDDKFDVLHNVLYQLEKKVGEHQAMEIIGNYHKRTLQALEVDVEDPRDGLEELSLLYLAPGIDVEALVNAEIEKGGGAADLMVALNKGEGAISPTLAEKVACHIFGTLLGSASEKGVAPASLFDEPLLLATKELLQTIPPIKFLNLFVLAWFEKALKTDLKGTLQALVEKEVLEKQWMLDFQDDVCTSKYRKAKQKSLMKLTSWFMELDLELNPPPTESEEEEEDEEEEAE